MFKTPLKMSPLNILVLSEKSPFNGFTFTMLHFFKSSLLQLMSVALLLLLLNGHYCQTTNEFNKQSNWKPVIPGQTRPAPQLESKSNDGATESTANFASNTVTTRSPPRTVSKDIRQLLEDYVTYLSTMPDFQKETSFAKKQHSQLNRNAQPNLILSTPQTFTLMSPANSASSSSSSSNDMEDTSHSSLKIGDESELQGSASTVISPVLGSSAHRLGSNYYLEMPTESGLTLSLSDEELSTFIDNVLSHSAEKDFHKNNNNTSTTNAVPVSVNEFEENAVVNKPESGSTSVSVILEKNPTINTFNATNNAFINKTEEVKIANKTTQIETNATKLAEVTTELPFSRLEMFENLDEIADKSNKDDLKESEKPYYTNDDEVVTEASYTDDLSLDDENETKTSSSSNETFSSEDETNSNIFNKALISATDTELLNKELKRTKELLRIQIDKLQLLEDSDEQNELLVSGQTTTTESPEMTTIEMVATERGLRDANDTNLEQFIVTTESPILLEETTTVSADESVLAISTTAIDSSPNDLTSEAPNEFNEALSATTGSVILGSKNGINNGSTVTTDSLIINEKLALKNYSRASLVEETIPSKSTTKKAKAPIKSVKTIANSTATTTSSAAKLSNKPLQTAVDDLRASTSKQESNVFWNRKPIVRGEKANGPENPTLPTAAFDLVVGEKAVVTFNTTAADEDTLDGTNSETMILTHVPKITIIHKIMKPSGNGGNAKGQKTDEEAYREALREHKDLIKTAMSSISLVPAAFKRYKINNKNKVNIGEIYLLPNFAGSNSNGHAGKRVLPQNFKTLQNRQFVKEFSKVNFDAVSPKLAAQQTPIIIRQVRTNTLPKFAYSQIENKFNTEVSHYSLINGPMIKSEHLQRQENPAKLYVKYLNSKIDRHHNLENILKLYRPSVIHRKRFKKVRIPSGYRLKKKETHPLTAFAATTQNDTLQREPNQVFTWLDASPILISVAQSSEQAHNRAPHGQQASVKPAPQSTSAKRPLLRSPLSSARSAGQQLLKREPLLSNNNSSSRQATATDKPSRFKVFCTYDAHRSLSAQPTANGDSGGRFFDTAQLEQNAPILQQCTHLVYAFASINMNGEVLPGASVTSNDGNGSNGSATGGHHETANTSALQLIKKLKLQFPHLKVLVAVGGWSTPPQLFSLLVATSKLRDRLCQNVHRFVLKYDFDGAIIAWFYPLYGSKSTSESSQRSPRSTSGQTLFQLDDKQNLVKFMRSLRNRFESIPHQSLEIGLMSPPFEKQIDRGYDVPKLSNLVDHLILLTFDYYGSWDDKVHHFAPLYPPTKGLLSERDSKLNINYTLSYWLNEKQAPREKTVLGLAFFGRSFTLEDPSAAEPGAKAIGPGAPIAGTLNQPGMLAFNEICDLYLGHPAVKLNEDEHHVTAHLQVFDQFVGFEDELSLYLKTKYAISNHLSGVFIWSINQDDYRNRCGWGRFPLLKAINKAVEHCEHSAIPCKV